MWQVILLSRDGGCGRLYYCLAHYQRKYQSLKLEKNQLWQKAANVKQNYVCSDTSKHLLVIPQMASQKAYSQLTVPTKVVSGCLPLFYTKPMTQCVCSASR